MLNVLIDVEIIDEDGGTTYAKARLSGDREASTIDLVVDTVVSPSDIVMFDPAEMRRALEFLDLERKVELAPELPDAS